MSASLVRLREIHKRYQQGEQSVEVLKGVSLDIAQGEFVALQGASGSGKSTLLHIIGLLDQPSEGSYELEGRDVSRLSDDALSSLRNRMTGFIFQSFYLIPYATALDNVMLPGLYAGTPRAELRRRGHELLERVGLGDRVGFTPAQLSGGQQQRVAIARALVNAPRILLADEPTGQLDSSTSGEIMDLIASIHATGMTVILVTHDEATATYAQRRVRMVDGRIEGQERVAPALAGG
ncbi:MAG: ABC transporter ATP-binding protein [Desulfocurvibacter africanus]